ncbi:hypothetical protein [Leptolyngbya ohadii]|uniref:hypothetical protein n=1 Tax=Leptolyngbya ohadii TaxID=1962290 RepID=UPI000B598794|nr:hypothetical protein [Leptolyngbya ohadii]
MTRHQKEALQQNSLNYCWRDGNSIIAASMHPYNGMKRITLAGHILPYQSGLELFTTVWNKSTAITG